MVICLCASCVKEVPAGDVSGGLSKVYLNLSSLDTKADSNLPSVDSFKVEILNSSQQVIRRWRTFKACKDSGAIYLNAGDYYVKASYGDSTATGFDVRSFLGFQPFTLAPQAYETNVSVACKPSNVKAGVQFGQNILSDYQEVIADIYNSKTPKRKLHFTPEDSKEGYVPAGNLVLSVEATDIDGSKGYFKDYSVQAKAGDHVTYKVDTKQLPSGEAIFELSVKSETIDTTITFDILGAWVSPEAPRMTFDGANGQTVFEGDDAQEARIDVLAQATITSLVLKIEKSAFLLAKGFETETELLATNPYTDLGLAVKGIATAKCIYFDKLIPHIEAVSGDNETILTLIATDGKGRQVSKTVSFNIEAPVFSISDVVPGDVFARSAKIGYSITKGSADRLTVEVSKDGITWQPAAVKGGSALAKSLEPGTTYQVRARYNSHASASKQFTTEAALQLPNSGFEDFHRKQIDYTIRFPWTRSYTRYEYYPYKETASDAEKCWYTNNALTCFNPGSVEYQAGKTFPSVNYLTSQYGAYEGNYSAEMRNVTIGSGSNALGIGATSIVMTCGKLFLATFAGGSAVEGRAFASRPTALEFYYKYKPLKVEDASNNKNNYQDEIEDEACEAFLELFSGDTKIASGTWTQEDETSTWTKAHVDLNYLNTSLKATSMKLIFKSSVFPDAFTAQPNYQAPTYKSNVTVTVNGESFQSSNTGSVFDVDNVTLIYEN